MTRGTLLASRRTEEGTFELRWCHGQPLPCAVYYGEKLIAATTAQATALLFVEACIGQHRSKEPHYLAGEWVKETLPRAPSSGPKGGNAAVNPGVDSLGLAT